MATPCCSEFFAFGNCLHGTIMSAVEMQKSSLLDVVFSLNDHLVFFSRQHFWRAAVFTQIYFRTWFFIPNVDSTLWWMYRAGSCVADQQSVCLDIETKVIEISVCWKIQPFVIFWCFWNRGCFLALKRNPMHSNWLFFGKFRVFCILDCWLFGLLCSEFAPIVKCNLRVDFLLLQSVCD